MNEPKPEIAVIAAPAKREVKIVNDDSPIAYLMDTARFEHCYRVAQMMSRASLIPKHLKGESAEQTAANCFLVVNQSIRWELDPFAVAPETYEVGGKLGFQGKLVAAVVNSRGGLAEKLSYTFNDKAGDDLAVTVSGRLVGEEKPRSVVVSVKEARTPNQMWTKDPHQKLCYTGATKWARRHRPEIMLGILTDDDLDAIKEEARINRAKPVFGPATDADQISVSAPLAADTTPPKKPKDTKSPSAHETAKTHHEPSVAPKLSTREPAPTTTATATVPEPEPTFEQMVDGQAEPTDPLAAVRVKMATAEVTEAQLVNFYNQNKGGGLATISALADIPQASLDRILGSRAMIARIKAL